MVKKRLTIITLMLVVVMSISLLAGCGKTSQQDEQAPTEDTSKNSEFKEKSSNDSSSDSSGYSDILAMSEEEAKEELYSILPRNNLTGVINPNMKDRSDIDKALPVETKDPEDIKIGWTEITLGNTWFVEIANAAKETSEKYGFDLNLQVADGDVQKQSQHFDTFITQGVDVIVLDPCDVMGPVADVKRAVEAGIPVITVGTTPDSSCQTVTTVVFNNFENGFNSGMYVAKQYDASKQFDTAMIVGIMGNSTSESRACGLISGVVYERYRQLGEDITKEQAILIGDRLFGQIVKKGKFDYPDIKFSVHGFGEGQWTDEGGLSAAEDLLAANAEKLELIFATNDFMGMGTLRALDNYGKKGEIEVACAADGVREAVDLVKSGELLVTGPCNGYANGAEAIELVKDIFVDGYDANNLPMSTFFDSYIITKENVDKYYDPDPENAFHKTPPLEVKTIPELKEELKE